MKKLGIIILFILLFGLWGLWYLGGKKIETPTALRGRSPSGAGSVEPSIDEKLIALVREARAANGRPLLDPALTDSDAELAPQMAGLVDEVTTTLGLTRLTLADLILASEDDPNAVKNYSQTVIEIFTALNSPAAGDELGLALTALEQQSPETAAAVKQRAERYRELASRLLALPAPPSLKHMHLNLLNSILGLAEIDFYLSEILAEPLSALDRAQTFAHRYERFAGAILILNQVLANHGLPIIAVL